MLPLNCLLRQDWDLTDIEDFLKHDPSRLHEEDTNGRQPLFHALADRNCSVDVIKLLIRYGANVNFKEMNDRTPLCAALDATRDEAIISLLLENGANVLSQYRPRRPYLIVGKESTLCIALHNGASEGVVRLLLDAGCPLTGCENEDHGPVLFCAVDDDEEGKGPRLREDVLRLLIQRGADVNAINGGGLSVMCYALFCGRRLSEVQTLLAVGVPLNACAVHTSPFLCATDGGSPLTTHLAEFLLHKGAPLDHVDKHGLTPLQRALKSCKYEAGAISLLLRYLPDMDVVDSHNNNLLGLAVANLGCCDPSVVKLLIERGVRVDNANVDGKTALHKGACNSLTFCPVGLRLLLKNGATVDAKDDWGKTPLDKAVMICWFNIKTVRVLLAAGAHVGRHLLKKVLTKYEKDFDVYLEELEEDINCGGLSYFQILLKYALLQNPLFSIKGLMEGHKEYETLSKYWEDCVVEQRRMECVTVGEGCTLREFLKEYSIPQNEASKPPVKDYDFMQLLKIRANNVFPLFSDILSDKVDRCIMNAKLPEVGVFTMKYTPHKACKEEKVYLDYASILKIVQLLDDGDLCSFIVAFTNSDSHTYSGASSSREDLGEKRRSVGESTKYQKLQKLES